MTRPYTYLHSRPAGARRLSKAYPPQPHRPRRTDYGCCVVLLTRKGLPHTSTAPTRAVDPPPTVAFTMRDFFPVPTTTLITSGRDPRAASGHVRHADGPGDGPGDGQAVFGRRARPTRRPPRKPVVGGAGSCTPWRACVVAHSAVLCCGHTTVPHRWRRRWGTRGSWMRGRSGSCTTRPRPCRTA